jgi:quercetin dioxygenase-like cupin family protein
MIEIVYLALTCVSLLQAPASAPGVTVHEITRTATTAIGQRIELPSDRAEVIASIYTIAPGAALPVHKHRFPRYAYVLSGQVEVRTEDGKVFVYEPGAFIVEVVDVWHRGANVGTEPARLLVIDQVEPGTANTILREP